MNIRFLILFVALFLSSQVKARDYNKVDKYARSVHKTGDYKQLARKLAKPFASQKDKVRSIFIWITHNIKYDYRKFKSNQRRGGYRIKGRNKRDIAIKRKKRREKKIKQTYKTNKGVCEDYSYLFQSMCKAIGVETKYITGVTKTNPRQIGKFPKNSSHAWNAVKIEGKWFLLDTTWAAGTVNHKTGRYKRDYQEGFFLTKPELFIVNHFPDDKKWQLLKKPVNKKVFSRFSYPHGEFYKDRDILDYSPKSGYLNSRKKYSIVKIKYKGKVPHIVMFRRGKIVNLDYNVLNNEIALKIPTLARYHQNVVIGMQKGRKFKPLLEYKIK